MTRSDLTRTSGRFWSPDAPWNTPLSVAEAADIETTEQLWQSGLRFSWAVDAHAPTVNYLGPTARSEVLPEDVTPVRLPPAAEMVRPWQAIVDFAQRTVLTLDRWTADDGDAHLWHLAVPLDGDGWGSTAVGLILERELLSAAVPHAVGLAGPAAYYGRRLRLDLTTDLPSVGARTVGQALALYGGIVAATCDDRFMVLCEHSSTAVAGDQCGMLYRHLGIVDDGLDLGIEPTAVTVLA